MEFKRNLAAFLVRDFNMENKNGALAPSSQPGVPPGSFNENSDDKIRNSLSAGTNEFVLQDAHQIVEMETIIVEDMVKPLTFLFNYFLPFHDTISFDPVARCCVLKKGSLIRKLRCVLWQCLLLYRFGTKAIPSLSRESSVVEQAHGREDGALSLLARGAYVIFIIFTFLTFYVYWLKTEKVCNILNHVIGLAVKLHLHSRPPSRIKIVKVAVHGSWIFVTFYVIITAVLYVMDLFSSGYMEARYEEFKTQSSNVSQKLSKGVKFQMDFTAIHSSTDDFILIQIVLTFTSFLNIFTWMLTFLHMGCWGFLFKQLIMLFYWRICAKEEMGKHIQIAHEVRTFNKIGLIIEELNQIYGVVFLFAAVVCVTYISPSVKHAFSGLSDLPPQMGTGWHLMLSYIPMFAATSMIAEVHRKAGSFADVIKHQFGRFNKECGDPAECLCGIAIVHYDLATSNFGFKGLGFFTVSYQFITTIVSVIISYSILVVQLFPHDNSDIEV